MPKRSVSQAATPLQGPSESGIPTLWRTRALVL
jgi:hypothetical protein